MDEMRLWFGGITIIFFAVWLMYWVGSIINPINHLNLLECWGIIAMLILLKSGVDTYIKENYKE